MTAEGARIKPQTSIYQRLLCGELSFFFGVASQFWSFCSSVVFPPLIICRLFLCNRSHSPAGVPLKTRFIKSDHLSLFQCCLCCGSDLAPVWQQEKKKYIFCWDWEMALVVKTHKQRPVAADKWKTSSSVKNNLFFLLFSPFYWSSRNRWILYFYCSALKF